MKEMVVIARCSAVRRGVASFNFTGACCGHRIRRIDVSLPKSADIVQNRTYLLWLYLVDIGPGVIDSVLRRSTELDYG